MLPGYPMDISSLGFGFDIYRGESDYRGSLIQYLLKRLYVSKSNDSKSVRPSWPSRILWGCYGG